MTTAESKKPVLIGRYWLMPDGEFVPNIYGGDDDDGTSGTGDGAGDAGDGGDAGELRGQLDRATDELKRVRSEAAKYRTEAKDLRERAGDIDINKYNAMLEQEAKLEKEKLEAKGNYEEALSESQRRHEAALEQANKTTDQWRGMYSKQVIDNVLISQAADRAVDPAEVTTLIRSKFDFSVTDDGEVTIKDKDGNVVINESGQQMDTAQVMDDFLNSRLHLCKTKGGGTGSSGNASGGEKPDTSGMTAQQKIAVGLRKKMQGA